MHENADRTSHQKKINYKEEKSKGGEKRGKNREETVRRREEEGPKGVEEMVWWCGERMAGEGAGEFTLT